MGMSDAIVNGLAGIPDVWRGVGTFLRMDGPLAVVNVGDKSVNIPSAGFSPPLSGTSVQLERRNGQLVMLGPSVPLPALGTIKATGAPKCTVTAGGVDYILGYRSSYTPVIGDVVEINQMTGIIQGAVTVAPVDPGTDQNPGGGSAGVPTDPVLATDSGQWSTSYNKWQGNNPRASDTVEGAWAYGSRVQDALRGTNPSSAAIYLPLRSQLGVCYIATHDSPVLPAGGPNVGTLWPLDTRSGWVPLDVAFATYLRDNAAGIAVVSGDGDNNWTGTGGDALSGALRFS